MKKICLSSCLIVFITVSLFFSVASAKVNPNKPDKNSPSDSPATLTTSGVLPGDETWSGTVTLTGDVTVPEGATLTILPGTTVTFSANSDDTSGGNNSTLSELIVNGSLVAEGTQTEQIMFTSDAIIHGMDDWGGIHVTWGLGSKTLSLTYCDIKWSTPGVEWKVLSGVHSASITNSTISYLSGNGIYVYGENGATLNLDVTGNTVSDTDGYGIYSEVTGNSTHLNGSIQNNTISASGNYGIYLYTHHNAMSTVSVKDNTVTNSSQYGIYLNSYYTYANKSEIEVIGNDVSEIGTSTSHHGIHCYSYVSEMTVHIYDNEVYNNVGNGIFCTQNGSYIAYLDITKNYVHDNGAFGIYVDGYYTDPVITLNTVDHNTLNSTNARGINCYTSYSADILYNDVKNNTNGGLRIAAGDGSNVNFNNLINNGDATKYELYNDNASSVNARYNYWGADVTTEIGALSTNPKNITRIFDTYDNTAKGTVDYSSWLTSEVTLPTTLTSRITSPQDGVTLKTSLLRIQGVAVSPNGVDHVEVSVDGGSSWHNAEGTETWYYNWESPPDGTYTIQSRAIDRADPPNIETPGTGVTVTIDSTLPATTSGPLTGDETWSGTVTLTGDVIVPSGVSLTINPGTTIQFQALNDDQSGGENTSRIELIVKGSLTADGSSSPIVFTSTSENPVKGDWYGIRVKAETSNEAMTLSNVTVAYAQKGVDLGANTYACTVSITDSTFSHLSGNAIYIYGENGATINLNVTGNSVLEDTDGYGIYSEVTGNSTHLNGNIQNNTISASGSYGIYLYTHNNALSTVSVKDNTISNIAYYGIYLYSRYTYANKSEIEVIGNDVSETGTTTSHHGIYCYSYVSEMTVHIYDNEVYNNVGNGIYCSQNGSNTLYLDITKNYVHDNGAFGIYIFGYYTDPAITLNTVVHNTLNNTNARGIYCYTSNYPADILYNDVKNNTNGGMYIAASDGSNVNFNNLMGNGDATRYELYNDNASSVNARYNYWGARSQRRWTMAATQRTSPEFSILMTTRPRVRWIIPAGSRPR